MSPESQDSVGNDEQHEKEEHIKQRLKELGVSEESERPEQSFISKYGKYLLLLIFVGLVFAYGYEYSTQPGSESEQVAEGDRNTATMQLNPQAHAYGQYPMQPPWVQQRQDQMQQRSEPPEWVRERQAQMMQRPEPPAWVKERQAQMQQPPEPPQWVKDRQAQMPQPPGPPAWVQQQPPANMQYGPGYYPGNGYARWPTYPAPYYGGYPYHYGW